MTSSRKERWLNDPKGKRFRPGREGEERLLREDPTEERRPGHERGGSGSGGCSRGGALRGAAGSGSGGVRGGGRGPGDWSRSREVEEEVPAHPRPARPLPFS